MPRQQGGHQFADVLTTDPGHTFNVADSAYASVACKVESHDNYTVDDITAALAKTKLTCSRRERTFFKAWKPFLQQFYATGAQQAIGYDVRIAMGGEDVHIAAFQVTSTGNQRSATRTIEQRVFRFSWPENDNSTDDGHELSLIIPDPQKDAAAWVRRRQTGPIDLAQPVACVYPAALEHELLFFRSEASFPARAADDPMWRAIQERQDELDRKARLKEAEREEKRRGKSEAREQQLAEREEAKLHRRIEAEQVAEAKKRKHEERQEVAHQAKRAQEQARANRTCKGSCGGRIWKQGSGWKWCDHCDEFGMCPECFATNEKRFGRHENSCGES